MTQQSDRSADDESRLKQQLLKLAPKPSAQHNDNVMRAAEAKAKKVAALRQPKRGTARWFVSGLGIAASIVLAAIITWPPGNESPLVTAERGGRIADVVPVDGATVHTTPSRFEWPASAETRQYQLNVYSDAAELLWSSAPLTDTTWNVGDELNLSKGARYFWVVDLLESPGGKSIGPFWFSIE